MSATGTAQSEETTGRGNVPSSLSNRREIPVTSFDFLEGAYRRVNLSRRIVLTVAGLLLAGAATLGALSVPAWGSGSSAQAEAEILRQQREQTFTDLGAAAGVAISAEELIGRYLSVQSTYEELARRSPTIPAIFEALLQPNAGGGVSKAEIGYDETLVREVPHAADLPEDAAEDDRVRVRATVQGEDLAGAASAALNIRNSGTIQVTVEERAGVSGVLIAGVENTAIAPYSRQFVDQIPGRPSRQATLQEEGQ